MNIHNLRKVFLSNRAEQLPADVWGKFVIPPFFSELTIQDDKRSIRIEGGRGCGKTMFVRFFCHPTTFSKNRKNLSHEELRNVGLYWRPDTQFCSLMNSSWLGEKAKVAFIHYLALNVVNELIRSLNSISNANFASCKFNLVDKAIPDDLKAYFDTTVATFKDIQNYIRSEKAKFEIWVQNPKYDPPRFLKFESILDRVAEFLSEEGQDLEELFFRIFVDEFENLSEDQQRIINDHIKHPGRFFSVNIALRKHADACRETSGFEKVVEVHDYRVIDLENNLTDDSFQIFSAEVLILRLHEQGFKFKNCPVDIHTLTDPSKADVRAEREYQDSVKGLAKNILPQMTTSQISELVLKDEPLRRRLINVINSGLKLHGSELDAEQFIRSEFPEASITAASILNRKKIDPDVILSELQNLPIEKKSCRFYKNGGWVENNLTGVLFLLYLGLPNRGCLLYSGFERYCVLAKGNLRHFQELCHNSFIAFETELSVGIDSLDEIVISFEQQAQAAKDVSERLVEQIGNLGHSGNRLLLLVRRLGKIFQIAHKRLSQSEPEINHFSINYDKSSEDGEEIAKLIKQGKIWSVFYEQRDTKNKDQADASSTDIIINPIYAPYFGISHRKIRKINIKASEFLVLMDAAGDFENILASYIRKWGSEDDFHQLGYQQELI